MIGLSETKYSSVFLNRQPIRPWIIAESCLPQILLNAAFVKEVGEARKMKSFISRAQIQTVYQFQSEASCTLEECLEYLGVTSLGSPGAFISFQEYEDFRSGAELSLLTEKFTFPSLDSSGAGRHVLLKNAQLKSIGRNVLCVNEDYFHSWGGMVIQDALKAYVTAYYIDSRAKLPALKHLGMFTYESKLAGVTCAVILRDAQTFRLGQLFPNTLNDGEKVVVRMHLEDFFKSTDPHKMLDAIMDNYLHGYSIGIRYEALSPDNLLIDGRWIDTESVNLNIDKSPHDTWLQFSVPGEEGSLYVEKFRSLQDYHTDTTLVFKDSWIHRLYLMVQATCFVYQGLWDDFEYDLDAAFKVALARYFPTVDLLPWLDLLNQFDSHLIYRFSLPRKKSSGPTIDWNQWGQTKLTGYYFDKIEKGHQLTFGNDELNSHETMRNLVQRWEILFNPNGSDWENAFNLDQQIQGIAKS